jgi:peptidoglycan/LPS O-acetylase OafA/YrhL
MTKSDKPERFPRLDVLRGLAIAAVVMHHFLLTFTAMDVPAEIMPALGAANRWFFLPHELGYLGVKLFFVVSGFCIHNSYLGWRRRTAAPTVNAFLLNYLNRRFWRIYPPYAAALLLAFTFAYWPAFDLRALRHLAFGASLLNTLSEPFYYNINPAFWSIAVEWQLYVVYPLVLWLNRRYGANVTMALAAGTAAFWHFGLPHLTANWAVLHLPFRWWFEWCLGFWVAELLARGHVAIPRARPLATALLPVAVFALLRGGAWAPLGWVAAPLAFAAALQAACANARPLNALERAVAVVGLSSFSLYLFHNPMLWALRALLRPFIADIAPWALWTLVFALTFAAMQGVAWLLFRFLEQPSINVGKHVERTALPRLLPATT